MSLDGHDRSILELLQRDARLSSSRLSEKTGLSRSRCWQRVKRLEKRGIIRAYRAILDPTLLGMELSFFLNVRITMSRAAAFEREIAARQWVLQCHAVTGTSDYLVTAVAPNIASFDKLLREDIAHLPGVERIWSSLSLKTIKAYGDVPIS